MRVRVVSAVLCTLFWGISRYGCLRTNPLEMPFAYGSFVIGKTHATFGLIRSLQDVKECSKECHQVGNLMMCGQLTLINCQLHHQSEGCGSSILYGFWLANLLYYMVVEPGQKFWKRLLTLHNSLALIIRGNSEVNWIHIAMAILHWISVDGVDFLGKRFQRKLGAPISYLSMIFITYLSLLAFTEKS
ncbi:hypothetical protein KR009_002423 [Drosophila setifemur]|nr:hypothetical protein KR009_002423 [Drosophila setifemur]